MEEEWIGKGWEERKAGKQQAGCQINKFKKNPPIISTSEIMTQTHNSTEGTTPFGTLVPCSRDSLGAGLK